MEYLEINDNPQAAKKPHNKYSLLFKIYFVLTLLAQIFLTLVFCSGQIRFYGKNTDLLTMINTVFGIFDMGKSYYKEIFGCGLAIMYLILLAIMVSDVLHSVYYMKKGFNKISRTPEVHTEIDFWTYFWNMTQGVVLIIVKMLIFMVSVGFVKSYTLNFIAVIPILIGAVVFLSARLIYYVANNYTVKSTLINLCYYAILMISVGLIIINAHECSVENIISTFQNLGSSNFSSRQIISLLLSIVNDGIKIGIVYCAIAVIDAAFAYTPLSRGLIQSRSRPIITSFSIIVIIEIAMYGLTGIPITYNSIWDIVYPYLPLMFAIASHGLFIHFPHEREIKKVKVELSSETEPQNEEKTAFDSANTEQNEFSSQNGDVNESLSE